VSVRPHHAPELVRRENGDRGPAALQRSRRPGSRIDRGLGARRADGARGMTELPDTFEGRGPIQLLVLAFPGSRFRCQILPALGRLKAEGIVRVIDAFAVRKDASGRTLVATASDLDWDEATAFGAYLGSLTGYAAAGAEGMEMGAIAGAAELADGH